MIEYEIADKKFRLGKITAGQLIKLLPVLSKAPLDQDLWKWVDGIGEDIFKCFAIILQPVNNKMSKEEIVEFLSNNLPPQAMVDIMNDFFVLMEKFSSVKYQRKEIEEEK